VSWSWARLGAGEAPDTTPMAAPQDGRVEEFDAILGTPPAAPSSRASADRCRRCGGEIDWRVPGSLAFADGSAAHGACDEQAELVCLAAAGRRAVASPDALADQAEVMLRGEVLP
jgi:hypothetical protein